MKNQDIKQILETQQRMLGIVLDVQSKQTVLDQWFQKVDGILNQLFKRLDGLMILFNRHESEIAAMYDNYRRLEHRIESLESKVSN